MKKNNGKVSQKKAKRHSKNLKRISKRSGQGHYLNKFKQTIDLTPEQRANAEEALARSLELSEEELSVVEPWAVKNG